jgi:Ras-related protein Rab-18
VYDVSRRDTFENLDLWLQEVEVYSPAGGRDVVKLLVGNKVDKVRDKGLN